MADLMSDTEFLKCQVCVILSGTEQVFVLWGTDLTEMARPLYRVKDTEHGIKRIVL